MTRMLFAYLIISCAAFGSTISGKVTDEGGYAIPKASVKLFSFPDSVLAGSTSTDGKGHFHLSGVPAGTYSIQAMATGFLAVTFGPIQLPYAETFKRCFQLPLADAGEGGVGDTAKVAGRLETSSGKLSHAELCFSNAAQRKCARSDDNGEYVILLQPGSYDVTVKSRTETIWTSRLDLPVPGSYEDKVELNPEVK